MSLVTLTCYKTKLNKNFSSHTQYLPIHEEKSTETLINQFNLNKSSKNILLHKNIYCIVTCKKLTDK